MGLSGTVHRMLREDLDGLELAGIDPHRDAGSAPRRLWERVEPGLAKTKAERPRPVRRISTCAVDSRACTVELCMYHYFAPLRC